MHPQFTDSLIARFWSKVDKSGDCWLWTGARDHRGYGRFQVGRRHGTVLAHRLAWELHYQPIPDGILVCHTCDNPPCIRPDHLFQGTQRDNMGDASAKGRLDNRANRGLQRLTPANVLEIRARYARGQNNGALAAEFGISLSHFHAVVNGTSWRHI